MKWYLCVKDGEKMKLISHPSFDKKPPRIDLSSAAKIDASKPRKRDRRRASGNGTTL